MKHGMTKAVAGIGAAALVVGTAFAPTAGAQDEFSLALDDGTYQGSVDFNGGFGATLITDDGNGVLQIFLDGRLNGPAVLSIVDGELSGQWSLSGTSTTNGVLSGQGVEIGVEGDGTYTGSGEFVGVTEDARMVGELRGTNTVTTSGPFGSQTDTDDEPSEVDLSLTDPIADCGRVFAQLDLDLNQSIESIPGFSSSIIGLFSATAPEGDDTYVSELEVLAGEVAALWNRIRDPEEFALGLLTSGFDLLRRAESLDDNWPDDECRAKPNFINVLTLPSMALMERILADVEAGVVDSTEALFLIDKGLELGLRTGALGSGTPLRARAMAVAERTEVALNSIFDSATTGSDPSLPLATDAALMAEQYGWTLTNSAGVTSTDLLTTLGAE